MSQNQLKTWGGLAYESPSIDLIEIEVEQTVFQGSGMGIPGYNERPGI